MDVDVQNVKVAIRLRPLTSQQNEKGFLRSLAISSAGIQVQHGHFLKNKRFYSCPKSWGLFDQCFDQKANNVTVHQRLVQSHIADLFQGRSCNIILYGQTGSGKTHTVMGSQKQQGILKLFIEILFQKLPSNFSTQISVTQIYNDQVFDLLAEEPLSPLQILQGKKQFYVKGLSQLKISDSNTAESLIKKAELRRKYASTVMNHCSSRSHTIVKLDFQGKTRREQKILTVRSSMVFVDLAGSQRLLKRSSSRHEQRQNQSKSINKSLFYLTQVISQLSKGNQTVTFRNSPLTKLMKQSMGAGGKTILMVCLNPTVQQFQHTLSSLRFAQSAKKVKLRVISTVEQTQDIQALKQRLKQLQAQEQQLDRKEDSIDEFSEQQRQRSKRIQQENKLLVRKIELLQQMIRQQPQIKQQLLLQALIHNDLLLNSFPERELRKLLSLALNLKQRIATQRKRQQAISQMNLRKQQQAERQQQLYLRQLKDFLTNKH